MIAKTYQPGIYRQMPDAEYRAIPALSNSDLIGWAKGGRDIDPKHADYGSAFHAAILEPDVARERIVALEPKQKRDSHPLHVSPEHWVLTNSDYTKLVNSVAAVKDHPQLGKLMEMARADRDRCELVAVWHDDEYDLPLKAKIDQVTDSHMYDWKTTGSDPEYFSRSIGAFFYHSQAAHYMAGAKACGLDVQTFRFACSCKRPDKGHVCWIHEMDEAWMSAGVSTWRTLLNLYAKYGVNQ